MTRTATRAPTAPTPAVPAARRQPFAASCTNGVFAIPRSLVSQNKRRFKQGGYDLDLCYVHPRIIVMGFPSTGVEATYRNPRSEVVRFLETRHADAYFVYNFCSEKDRCYPSSVFNGRVQTFPIEDHNVPTFAQLLRFSDDAAAWLDANPTHVVALHCKAGKGRAGLMACVLLVRMHFARSAAAAIDQYNYVRVHDTRGLTVVSQRKWVQYYERLHALVASPVRASSTSSPRVVVVEPSFILQQLALKNMLTGVEPPQLRLQIYQLDSTNAAKTLVYQAIGTDLFEPTDENDMNDSITISGSVSIELKRLQCSNCRLTKHLKIWFNTQFIAPDAETGRVVFTRSEFDWVARDKKKRRIPAAMELELIVRAVSDVPNAST